MVLELRLARVIFSFAFAVCAVPTAFSLIALITMICDLSWGPGRLAFELSLRGSSSTVLQIVLLEWRMSTKG